MDPNASGGGLMDVLNSGINGWLSYNQMKFDAMKSAQLGQTGQPYVPGQPTQTAAAVGLSTTTMLMLGVGAAAVLVLALRK